MLMVGKWSVLSEGQAQKYEMGHLPKLNGSNLRKTAKTVCFYLAALYATSVVGENSALFY